jgi:hypothetical protein
MGPIEQGPVVEDHPITHPLRHCPACGSSHLDPVVEQGTPNVHHLCGDCSRCWRVELGFVHRMTPTTCHGCPERARCAAAFAADQEHTRI